jgi:hypothetical protein
VLPISFYSHVQYIKKIMMGINKLSFMYQQVGLYVDAQELDGFM